jgi:hypothetical protein
MQGNSLAGSIRSGTLVSWSAGGSTAAKFDFSPVDSEELGYALSLFVAVANRQVPQDSHRCIKTHRSSLVECEQLYLQLSRPHLAYTGEVPASSETTLPVAFAALWHHYEGKSIRHSVCARVLGFYFLTEETAGAVIAEWIALCPDQPQSVLLDPSVVEGLSTVQLGEAGDFSQWQLRKAIETVLAN